MESFEPDEAAEVVGLVVYAEVSFRDGTSKRLRIPVDATKDSEEEAMTHEVVIDAVNDAFTGGEDGYLTLPHRPKEWSIPGLFFAPVGAIRNVIVEPPRAVRKSAKPDAE